MIFLGEFSHCGYKCFFEEIGGENIYWCEFEKKIIKKRKYSTKFSNHKIGKKKEKKTRVQRYICVCTLNKVWKNML